MLLDEGDGFFSFVRCQTCHCYFLLLASVLVLNVIALLFLLYSVPMFSDLANHRLHYLESVFFLSSFFPMLLAKTAFGFSLT